MGQATRAAALVYNMLKWRQGMQAGTVEPDGFGDALFCMSEYERLFCTCRIPVAGGTDHHLTEPTSRHIIVLRGDSFHKLTVVGADGAIATQSALEATLQRLIDLPATNEPTVAALIEGLKALTASMGSSFIAYSVSPESFLTWKTRPNAPFPSSSCTAYAPTYRHAGPLITLMSSRAERTCAASSGARWRSCCASGTYTSRERS